MAEYFDMNCDLPPDYTVANNCDVPAEHCDAPFDANQSLEERMQEMHPDLNFSDGTTEQLKPGHQDIDPFELAEDFGSVGEGMRGAKDGASEIDELNTALNQQDSADNCDPPQYNDVGVDLNDT